MEHVIEGESKRMFFSYYNFVKLIIIIINYKGMLQLHWNLLQLGFLKFIHTILFDSSSTLQMRSRMVGIWDVKNTSKPLQTVEVDNGLG